MQHDEKVLYPEFLLPTEAEHRRCVGYSLLH